MAHKPTNPYYHPEERGNGYSPRPTSPYNEKGGANAVQQRAAAARRKKAAHKKRVHRLMAVLAVVLVGCGVVCFAVYNLLNNLVTGGAAPLPDDIVTEDALQGDVVNILCAGIDFEEGRNYPNGMGFTDVILYVSFDIKANKISMLQIPRDTYIGDAADTGGTGKINAVAMHSESDPPIAALASLINQQFKLPIDYYITIDMDAFKEAINALGGIEVTIPRDIVDDYGNTLPAGTHKIDGATAEFMVRQRHMYGNQDIGRLEMQRYMYSALLKTFKSLPLTDAIKLIPTYIKYVKTDINLAKMYSLANKVVKVPSENILMFTMPGEGCTVNKQSVFSTHLEATAEILNEYFRPYSDPVSADQLGLIELQNTVSSVNDGTGQSMDSIDDGTAQWGQGNIPDEPETSSSSAPAA
ncbi:MAG TPA: LCP family protein [Candidatus Pygmaiobacter gallistercoris]|nr:LCP family protein [Candidatus Pygmaiobacter gallistercoris]